jgi:hypothetical protein
MRLAVVSSAVCCTAAALLQLQHQAQQQQLPQLQTQQSIQTKASLQLLLASSGDLPRRLAPSLTAARLMVIMMTLPHQQQLASSQGPALTSAHQQHAGWGACHWTWEQQLHGG